MMTDSETCESEITVCENNPNLRVTIRCALGEGHWGRHTSMGISWVDSEADD